MKKLCILLLCLTMLLVSCNQPQKADDFETENPSASTAESTVASSEEESSIASTEATVTPDPPEPPMALRFGSFDEVRRFITAVEASEQAFEKYEEEYGKQTIFWGISYKEAQEAASALASIPFPIVSQDLEFSMAIVYSYYQDHDWLEVNYTVEGIQCRFSYDLNCSSEKEISNQEYREAYMAANVPDFPNVPFGEYTINLYAGEPYTVGWCQTDSVWVFAKFRTTQIELLKLEELQFSKLLEIPTQAPTAPEENDNEGPFQIAYCSNEEEYLAFLGSDQCPSQFHISLNAFKDFGKFEQFYLHTTILDGLIGYYYFECNGIKTLVWVEIDKNNELMDWWLDPFYEAISDENMPEDFVLGKSINEYWIDVLKADVEAGKIEDPQNGPGPYNYKSGNYYSITENVRVLYDGEYRSVFDLYGGYGPAIHLNVENTTQIWIMPQRIDKDASVTETYKNFREASPLMDRLLTKSTAPQAAEELYNLWKDALK